MEFPLSRIYTGQESCERAFAVSLCSNFLGAHTEESNSENKSLTHAGLQRVAHGCVICVLNYIHANTLHNSTRPKLKAPPVPKQPNVANAQP
jgi:hypothetical protein